LSSNFRGKREFSSIPDFATLLFRARGTRIWRIGRISADQMQDGRMLVFGRMIPHTADSPAGGLWMTVAGIVQPNKKRKTDLHSSPLIFSERIALKSALSVAISED
jgi:hypothetical protein